jgi:hypothetical protein
MTKEQDKKLEEQEYLNGFKETNIGKQFYENCSIADVFEATEQPDFILKTKSEKLIGIELTEFIVRNKNTKYTQALTRIGNQICKYAKKQYDLCMSMTIEQFDKLLWSPNWNNHLKRTYDPGFSDIPSHKEFKERLQEFVSTNMDNLKKKAFVKGWITIQDEHFQISIITFPSVSSGKFDCHVNNGGWCKENPIEDLQVCIDEKNNKFENYVKKCDDCYLLVILQDSSKGSFCFYTDSLLKHKYISKFKEVFFYDEKKKQAYKLCTQ